jgi:transmembrane sensor
MAANEGGPDEDDRHDAAIDWWVRQRAAPLTVKEKSEFAAWLAEEDHRTAYSEIERMCGELERLEEPAASARSSRVVQKGRALLATAALAAAGLAFFLAPVDLFLAWRADYYAPVGETRFVTLEDGSHVHLDARSAIAVRYDGTGRNIALLQGEAWFEVAPDPERPFVVEAARGSVTARGTAFDVALDGAGARVAVTEHSVRISSGGADTLVSEGEEAVYDRDAPASTPTPISLSRATAWRRGKLVFEDRPLGEALAALSRYRRGYVYCLDRSICAQRVTGVFSSDDPAQALREIEAYLGLKALRLTDYLILLHY